MKARGAMIQGALAVVGLGAAYATWQREPEKVAGEVVVVEATKAEVSRVRFEDDKGWVELWRGDKGESGEPTAWVKISAREERGQKVPDRELRGNDSAVRLIDGFGPLKASRALGAIAEEAKLKEFGLVQPDPPARPDGGAQPAPPAWKKRTVTATIKGEPRTFTLGSPQGLFATYLRDERDGRVYLLGGSLAGDLEAASSRMVDRAVHGFKAGEFDALTVEAGGKSRQLVVLGDSPALMKLASARTPEKADETARNWHEKVMRLFPTEVLGRGEKPAAGEPQTVLKIAYAAKGKDKGFMSCKVTPVAPTPPPAPSPPDAKPPAPPAAPAAEYYVRSEHTAGWLKLGGGTDDLVKEAEKIAAAE